MKIAVTNPEDWVKLRRANYTHSDAASQGGGWWQGCGAAYPRDPDEAQQPQEAKQ